MFLFIIILPILLGMLILFGNNILKLSDYIVFCGSYFGDGIGGICILGSIYFILKDNFKAQKENKESIIDIQDENKRLILEIQKENKKCEIIRDKKALCSRVSEHVAIYLTYISNYFYSQYRFNIKNGEGENIDLMDIDKTKASEMYFLLKIELNQIPEAGVLLDELEMIHNDYCYIEEVDNNLEKVNEFQNHADLLMEKTKRFVDDYIKI
ncbi:MAG: hypothetical protein Q4E31_08890 [Intestinibacter bartlettii]|nr:hypothetical protein [Intestinibacter bartlettii]